MPQAVALVAVADQQLALALEQAGAVDFNRVDRGWPLGGVVRAVGRFVRVRLDGEHRSTPLTGATNANDSHLPVKRFSDRLPQAIAASTRAQPASSTRAPTSSASRFCSSCATRLAPRITLDTCGLRRHQAIASGAGPTPSSAASAVNA